MTTGINTIMLEVSPSQADRFVVVNTRWHPGWSARAGEQDLQVYEANGFMLGVRVPAHAGMITLTFHPLSWVFRPITPAHS